MPQKSFFILSPFITANSIKLKDIVQRVLWEFSNSALGGNCF